MNLNLQGDPVIAIPVRDREAVGKGEGAVQASVGTVTFLFSDIEGSTGLLHRLGDRYAEVLTGQRQLLRAAFEERGGREVDTAGDGSFVVFGRARDAVAAAVDAQQALARHDWPEHTVVRVRMGLHTGEPVAAAGSYVGLDVHRAARICSAASGGQVLLSETTRNLVEQDLPAGVGLRDLGACRLKDLPHPERLFQLVIPDLPSDFPPLKTLTSRPGNLPASSTEFIGREQEVETVRQLVLRPPVRLVTLTGPGGTGKTRLALEAAAGLREAFEDGVFFISLATIADPALVPSSIATTLGIMENPARPVLESVKDHLLAKEMLLVLDNFEQVVASVTMVAELLAVCPKVKVLATSRVVLHLSGEYEYQVPPLALPDPQHALSAGALSQFAAIVLFVRQAQAARRGFELTDENAAAVAEVCYRLDGLPLAIELAAARVKLFSPQAMLARLGSRLDLLKGGARDLHPRHQTLRQAMAWSYDLLEPDEQAFFRRVAVFMDGFTLEAAEAVCNACDALATAYGGCSGGMKEVVDAVGVLVDHSLLRQEEGPEGEPRFVMLETIREYGVECLQAAGEEEAVRRAHARYFLALAEQAEPELKGHKQAFWLARLEDEHDNLRMALAWAEEQGEAEVGLRLGAALWWFWTARGRLREGRERLERLLGAPGAQAKTKARARVLNGVGTIVHEISDFAASRVFLEESLSICRDIGDREGMAAVLTNLAWVATMEGDIPRAHALSEEALLLNRELGDKRGVAVTLQNLAMLAVQQSNYALARTLYQESLTLRREVGDQRGGAYTLSLLVLVELYQGRLERAEAQLEEAMAVFRALGDRQLTAWTLFVQGRAAYDQGHAGRAAALLQESVRRWREVDNRAALAWALALLGEVVHGQGDSERGAAYLDESLALWRAAGSRWGTSGALCVLGRILHARGQPERAAGLIRESLALAEAMENKAGVAVCLEAMALVCTGWCQPVAAAQMLSAADAFREEIESPLPPQSRAAYDGEVEELRTILGEEAFMAAWREGRKMTLQAACERVRSIPGRAD